jgi:hypothetical protein
MNIKCLNLALRIETCRKPDVSGSLRCARYPEPMVYDPRFPCAASPPTDARLAELLMQIEDHHPGIQAFSLLVRCDPDSRMEPKRIGPVEWKLQYPTSTGVNSELTGEPSAEGESHVNLLPFSEGSHLASLIVTGRHAQSACCLNIRHAESYGNFTERGSPAGNP